MKEQAKHKILAALAKCGDGGAGFASAARGLFAAMGYDSGRSIPIDSNAKEFVSEYPAKREKTKSQEHFCEHVQRVMGLFQFSDSEMEAAGAQDKEAFDKSIVKSFLFFAAQVVDGGHSRGDYAKWTREINKRFAIPAVVLFYCVKDGEMKVTFSFVGSRQSKVVAQERVLEAVSLLREIDAKKPHRGHLDILAELSFDKREKWLKGRKHPCERKTNFDNLLSAWLEELSADSLSDRFYRSLREWFDRAVNKSRFPKNMPNESHVIYLINRILFIWFLKEKGLVSAALFEPKIGDCLNSRLSSDSGDYYCAVLQNLFFGTLNTKINDRKFRDSAARYKPYISDHKDPSLYRYEDLISDKSALLRYFEKTPFVNGGLFDCLDDFANPKEGGKRVDCFTDNSKDRKLLHVPNHLFFDENKDSLGLFVILNRYKFTVEENTSTEQEIALDPELLGKVYERLLDKVSNILHGKVNQTLRDEMKNLIYGKVNESLRKEIDILLQGGVTEILRDEAVDLLHGKINERLLITVKKRLLDFIQQNRDEVGAYYTPRFIVDYMMRESLTMYFLQRIGGEQKCRDLELRLRNLLTAEINYDDLPDEEKLNCTEIRQFIEGAAKLRLLDPAVGSGAFLMGALAQLTLAFNRVDPQNQVLYEREKQWALQSRVAEHCQEALEMVEKTFSPENAYNNYGRKLMLVRECLFGVDVLPAAVHICRLRFFISLVIEQKSNHKKKENYGIQPLPNLETRMVAADALCSVVDKGVPIFQETPEVLDIKKQLLDIRRQFFAANARSQKRKFIVDDEKKRKELAEYLISRDFPKTDAERIAEWDLYDSKSSVDWFDPEWMFGVKKFDIVIGNPPYARLQDIQSQQTRKYRDEKFHVFEASGDIYQLFFERGHMLLDGKGYLCFITSNKWMRAKYGKKMRDWFGEKTGPLKLLDLWPDVFKSATVDPSIFMFAKNPLNPQKLQAAKLEKEEDLLKDLFPPLPIPQKGEPWVVLTREESALKMKIEKAGQPLKDMRGNKIYRGVLTGRDKAFVIDNETKEGLIKQDPRSAEIIKPILRGRDIKRYRANWAGKWLIDTHNGYGNTMPIDVNNYPAIKAHLDKHFSSLEKRQDKGITPYNLRNCAYHALFEGENIAWQRITQEPRFCKTTSGMLILDSMAFLSGEDLGYIAAILNSKLIAKYVDMVVHKYGNDGYLLANQYVESMPIPNTTGKNERLATEITAMAECVFAGKERGENTSDLENRIDALVYAIYGLDRSAIDIVESFAQSRSKISRSSPESP